MRADHNIQKPTGRPRLPEARRQVQFTLSIPRAMREALYDYAAQTGRTPTAAARWWLKLGAEVAETGGAPP